MEVKPGLGKKRLWTGEATCRWNAHVNIHNVVYWMNGNTHIMT